MPLKNYLFRTLTFVTALAVLFILSRKESAMYNPAYANYYLKAAESCLPPACQAHEKIVLFQKANRYNPLDSRSYYDIGALLESQGEFDQAFAYYKNGAGINFDDFKIQERLGRYYFDKAAWLLSYRHYALAARKNYLCDSCHFRLGEMLQKLGDYEKSIIHYLEVTGSYPDWRLARARAGVLYFLIGQENKARWYVKYLRNTKEDVFTQDLEAFIDTGKRPDFMP